jgi:hypothetical protein
MLLAEDLIAGASDEVVEGFDNLDLTIDLVVRMHGVPTAAAGARSYRLQLPQCRAAQ